MLMRQFPIPVPLFTEDCAWRQRADAKNVHPIQYNDKFIATTNAILAQAKIETMTLNYKCYTFPIFEIENPVTFLQPDLEIQTYDPTERFGVPLMLPWYRDVSGVLRVRGIPLGKTDLSPS